MINPASSPRGLCRVAAVAATAGAFLLISACGSSSSSSTSSATTAASGSSTTAAPPTTMGSTKTAANNLKVGDCFNLPSSSATTTSTDVQNINKVDVVDCATPHDVEVSFIGTYPAGTSDAFPGDSVVQAHSDQQCKTTFQAYVGKAYDQSALNVLSIRPTSSSWAGGDRTEICAVGNQDHTQITGSVKGSAK